MGYYVYILECHDGSYYTGMTNNLERRLEEHNAGFNPGCYTYARRPLELKYFEHFQNGMRLFHGKSKLKGGQEKRNKPYLKVIGIESRNWPNRRIVNDTMGYLLNAISTLCEETSTSFHA